jgi:hypothetical protein
MHPMRKRMRKKAAPDPRPVQIVCESRDAGHTMRHDVVGGARKFDSYRSGHESTSVSTFNGNSST